uniref:Si:ch73-380l3.2 n=1 Tax=Sphaeramia orbicularis TaxID=375764 RepID=A0A673AIU9_9TELE
LGGSRSIVHKVLFMQLSFVIAVCTDGWKVSVVESLDALVSSCVVLPCTFSHPHENLPTSKLRGKWHVTSDRDQLIYYEDSTRVLENFRGRTKLLGKLGDGNCTLEMIEVKEHDSGPFCFRIEIARTPTDTSTPDKFSFVKNCVTLNMIHEPPKPSLAHKIPVEGYPFTITCSVTHTCPSHIPKLTWSRGSENEITEHHRKLQLGMWETQSILTFIPKEDDDHKDVTCTAEFNGQRTSEETMTLFVKRAVNYNHIIIPTVVAIITAGIFGGLCIFMMKKYKKRINELQSQDGTMWNRMSRISRR